MYFLFFKFGTFLILKKTIKYEIEIYLFVCLNMLTGVCKSFHFILWDSVFLHFAELYAPLSHCYQLFLFLMDAEKSFIVFVISGTHQHNYNHVALGSPTRTPKNGKKTRRTRN